MSLVLATGTMALALIGGAVPPQPAGAGSKAVRSASVQFDATTSDRLAQPIAAAMITPQLPQVNLTSSGRSELCGSLIAIGLFARRVRHWRLI